MVREDFEAMATLRSLETLSLGATGKRGREQRGIEKEEEGKQEGGGRDEKEKEIERGRQDRERKEEEEEYEKEIVTVRN